MVQTEIRKDIKLQQKYASLLSSRSRCNHSQSGLCVVMCCVSTCAETLTWQRYLPQGSRSSLDSTRPVGQVEKHILLLVHGVGNAGKNWQMSRTNNNLLLQLIFKNKKNYTGFNTKSKVSSRSFSTSSFCRVPQLIIMM